MWLNLRLSLRLRVSREATWNARNDLTPFIRDPVPAYEPKGRECL